MERASSKVSLLTTKRNLTERDGEYHRLDPPDVAAILTFAGGELV